ncbi:MAG: hypothetical protein KDC95_18335 [Planctomycetes bacterium]|nr:hypothetical protein [Planctomycetota bacterium]
MARSLVASLATVLLAAAVLSEHDIQAQTASYTIVGPGCVYNNKEVVTFQVRGLPRLGTTYTLTVTSSFGVLNRNKQVLFERIGFVATGFSDKRFGPIPLPFDTGVLGPDWCGHLRISLDWIRTCAYAMDTVDVRFAIPNDARLLGLSLYQQAFAIVRVGPPAHAFSRSGHAVIGT